MASWLTIKLAGCTTLILLVLGTPLAWWLAHTRTRSRPLIEAIIALPLVLPPTVIGFYLLLAFSPRHPIGEAWQTLFGSQLAFSFSALVIGSVVYSLPFVVQPLQASFATIPRGLLEAAATLGAGPLDRLHSVVWPLARPGFAAAASLGFAHTVGEFGIVLMIGGNIPGETQVLAIALYDQVELLNYPAAHRIALGLIAASLLALTLLYRSQRRWSRGSVSWR